MRRSRIGSRAILLLAALPTFVVAAEDEAKPAKTVLIIAGDPDASHPRGTHEYERSADFLRRAIEQSTSLTGVRAEVHRHGWPHDEAAIERADAIVVIASGSDRKAEDHPLLVGDRLEALARQMKRGCGLVLIHWSTFFPNDKAEKTVLDWVGGHFDYQSGAGPNHWASAIKLAPAKVKALDTAHPIARGVAPFELREEFYYDLKFKASDPKPTPILGATIEGIDGEKTVAWALERPDGGRGFGFTGGHFFENWALTDFRTLVLNAIVWSAKGEVPIGGVPSSPPPAEGAKVALAEGKFGQALDARESPVLVDGAEAYRNPPLSVECWAKLDSPNGFNVLVASDTKVSPRHWELYTYAGSGALAAYLPGYTPSAITSDTPVCDKAWHHLAMTFDGKSAELFVDGRSVAKQAIRPLGKSAPNGGLRKDGPLMIGMAQDSGAVSIGCAGVVDEVRISRGKRNFAEVPKAELTLDPLTLGLWKFDKAEADVADAAWTPRPLEGNAAAWERETDADWVDGRFRLMDTGPFLNATMDYPSWGGAVRAYKGTAIKVGPKGEGGVLFDRGKLRWCAGWTGGGFLVHSDRRFGLLNTPKPAGPLQFATAKGPGWASPDGGWADPIAATGPIPAEWGKYRGLALHGDRVVVSYTVGDVAVSESPWLETAGEVTAFTRELEVGPSARPLKLLVAELPAPGKAEEVDGIALVATSKDGSWYAASARGEGISLAAAEGNRIELTIPPSASSRRLKLWVASGHGEDHRPFAALVKGSEPAADLAGLAKPGPARWGEPIVTKGEVGEDSAAYVVDTITVPYENRFNSLMFLGGVDAFPNGDLAVCSAHGDVWRVGGVDDTLSNVTWRRYASGLCQPLGLKMINGEVHVIERGQLTRLRDLNGDGEADSYESVNNAWHTGDGEHSFDTCLETDLGGNFYFYKTGDAETPQGGSLLRVSADGSKMETFATGFRHPIGLGASPTTGMITGADQEGNWMPSTRIDAFKEGGFYGDLRTHHRPAPPAEYDQPICWLPREADNSAGGQVWAPEQGFGPLSGRLIHFSYGRCKPYLVMMERIGDRWQGGAIDLGLHFLSGSARGRFHPRDGHLYVVGLRGWQTAARRDGSLQRVRYTGKPWISASDLKAHADGVTLTFSQPISPAEGNDPGRYRIEQWNYRWSSEYGSKRWSVANPGEIGQDLVPVLAAKVSKDGKSVRLTTPPLQPVMQMRINYTLRTDKGEPCAGTIYNTIHEPGSHAAPR